MMMMMIFPFHDQRDIPITLLPDVPGGVLCKLLKLP